MLILCFLFGFSLALNVLFIALIISNRKSQKIFSNLKKLNDFDIFDDFYSGDSIEDRKEV